MNILKQKKKKKKVEFHELINDKSYALRRHEKLIKFSITSELNYINEDMKHVPNDINHILLSLMHTCID
jgi:hypothetical protein